MNTLLGLGVLVASSMPGAANPAPDPYGANGPCAQTFKLLNKVCLDGSFTLEIEIGPGKEIISSRVISTEASEKSSGPVDPVAQCVASNMEFYRKAYLPDPVPSGKITKTIHVVNAGTCP